MKTFRYIEIYGKQYPLIYAKYLAERIDYDKFEQDLYDRVKHMEEMSDYRKNVEIRRLFPVVTKQLLWYCKIEMKRYYIMFLRKTKLIKIPPR